MKIYTKTGDRGQTSLYGGKRVSKDDVQVEAYGTVDELNSAIGVVIAELESGEWKMESRKSADKILHEIQSDLLFIGAMLAGDKTNAEFRIKNLELRTKELESLIDWMVGQMPEQKHFILPGGSSSSSLLHLARTICRRAERRVVSLINLQATSSQLQAIVIYLNRLSDFLYTLARFANFSLKISDVEWKS